MLGSISNCSVNHKGYISSIHFETEEYEDEMYFMTLLIALRNYLQSAEVGKQGENC